MKRTAIATLTVGAEYSRRFEALCRKNWTAYAERHGMDLFVFDQPLDLSERARGRSPAWQKCLILSEPGLRDYGRVVWVDSDICINPAAPSILDGVPQEKIGAIDEHSFPSPLLRQQLLEAIIASVPESGDYGRPFWEAWREPGAWHAFTGLPEGQKHIVQTGVMVLSPEHHRGLLEHIYRAYEDGGSQRFNQPSELRDQRNAGWGEMRPVSHEIQARALQHWIDPKFNALVWWLFLKDSALMSAPPSQGELTAFVRKLYRENYLLHFAGAAHLMPLLENAS